LSKKVDDLVARLQGNTTALVGMKNKVSPPEEEQPPSAPTPAPDDVQTYERLIEDTKGVIASLEAEVKKENKTPETDATKSKSTSTKSGL
jgi:hypothetical protein